MQDAVNTQGYWEERFSSRDWNKYDGGGQSAYFSQLAVNAFPEWLRRDLSRHSYSVTDWGCAQGDGTALLARVFPACGLTGVDFSAAAVEQAAAAYPYCSFEQGDIHHIHRESDVVFCSNTLEHLRDPRTVLEGLVASARRHAIILVPLHEENPHPEHFCVFNEDFFPLVLGEHRLSAFRILDCARQYSPYWSGEQLMLVYTRTDVLGDDGGSLADLFSNDEYEALKALLRQEEAAHTSTRVQFEQLSQEHGALQQEHGTLQREHGALQQEHGTLRQVYDTLQREHGTLQQEHSALQQEHGALRQEHGALQQVYDTLQQEHTTLQQGHETLLHENSTLREENNAFEQLREQLVDKLGEARQEHDRAMMQIREQEQRAQELEAISSSLQGDLHAARATSAALTAANDTATRHLENLIRSPLYQLAHFISRLRRQGFSRSRDERRAFRRWFRGHLRGEAGRDNHYNPLYIPYSVLRDVPAPVTAPAPPAEPEREQSVFLDHLYRWGNALDADVASPLTEEARKLREAMDTRSYKGIMVYPHVVFWEPLQTPQQLLRAFAREGWLCFFCESPWSAPEVTESCEVEPNLFITKEKDFLQAVGETHVTVMLTWMGSHAFVERIPHKTIWYHILDHLEIFSYYDEQYQRMHERYMESAAAVSYVARPLAELYPRKDAIYLPNGVNEEITSYIRDGLVPEDLQPILQRGGKIIGYYGYLAEWMDYPLVAAMARTRPEYQFVFIGKAVHDTSLIEGLDNVHLLGLKPHKELFDYAKFFDVAIIPFLVDEKMDCVSPIKFYEYLTLGLPVVSSSMKELDIYDKNSDFIFCANGTKEFLAALDRAVSAEVREAARLGAPVIAAENAWLARARTMSPKLLAASADAVLQPYTKMDVIVLSIIDYDFRHQRPQHFAQRFARLGHRVFYVNTNFAAAYGEKELDENLTQVVFSNEQAFSIHVCDWRAQEELLQSNLERLIRGRCIRDAVVVVDYPNWLPAAHFLKERYGFRVVCDYMDDFTGFINPAADMVRENCIELLDISDGVAASSLFLQEIACRHNKNVALIRNGAEYEYFHSCCDLPSAERKRPVIGYYGAIAEWFNADVVCRCARRFPQCDVVLVGAVTAHREQLEACENIRLVGEVPYTELLPYLASFDVCLIPFDTSTDLIKATNPVKFYEYLSAGKKIVATEIPELLPYKDRFAYLENDPERFCEKVGACLDGSDCLAGAEECFAFAAENDWDVRARQFMDMALGTFPMVSVIVLCYNQLDYTRTCVDSILQNTAYPNYELIMVDNASSDGTADYLRQLASREERVRLVLNDSNRGFAGGNNDGLAIARGEYLLLLNNDTVVTRGWLTNMVKHFRDWRVGLVGPLTNSCGNEARIPVDYKDMDAMHRFAFDYTQRHMGGEYPHRGVLAMFCLMISRAAYESIGPLDENYGIGMFEDDDYTMAAWRKGFEAIMAEDAFIHHCGSVSFNVLEDEYRMGIFNANRRYFENKWHCSWRIHQLREELL